MRRSGAGRERKQWKTEKSLGSSCLRPWVRQRRKRRQMWGGATVWGTLSGRKSRLQVSAGDTSGCERPRYPELLEAPKARPRRQSEAPIRYLPVPHSAHTARSAGRPFFIVTRSTSRDGVLVRHFKQYISTASEGVPIVSYSTGWRQTNYGQPACRVPERHLGRL